ncbi:MAG: FAD binding domain-containing protein [Burkholderiales bacterium]|nr:FAD binding domain-containing protein [Burkholderiales bacterium]
MKLPSFDYAAPSTLQEAVSLLGAHAGSALAIAGGQSLLPMLAYRLVAPSLLIDLRRVPGLDAISVTDEGVCLGSKVRWCDVESDARLRTAHPLLAQAVTHVGHSSIRNRGTVGGSLAHADPAAELPGIALTCDAQIAVAGALCPRTIRAEDFFLGPMTTALASDELIVELRFPAWPAARRWAFEELARQRGAFAIAGLALYYDLRDAAAANVHIGVFGAGPRPQRITQAEAALNGRVIDEQAIAAAARTASATVEAIDDVNASAAYRRSLVGTLLERALTRAAQG